MPCSRMTEKRILTFSCRSRRPRHVARWRVLMAGEAHHNERIRARAIGKPRRVSEMVKSLPTLANTFCVKMPFSCAANLFQKTAISPCIHAVSVVICGVCQKQRNRIRFPAGSPSFTKLMGIILFSVTFQTVFHAFFLPSWNVKMSDYPEEIRRGSMSVTIHRNPLEAMQMTPVRYFKRQPRSDTTMKLRLFYLSLRLGDEKFFKKCCPVLPKTGIYR